MAIIIFLSILLELHQQLITQVLEQEMLWGHNHDLIILLLLIIFQEQKIILYQLAQTQQEMDAGLLRNVHCYGLGPWSFQLQALQALQFERLLSSFWDLQSIKRMYAIAQDSCHGWLSRMIPYDAHIHKTILSGLAGRVLDARCMPRDPLFFDIPISLILIVSCFVLHFLSCVLHFTVVISLNRVGDLVILS